MESYRQGVFPATFLVVPSLPQQCCIDLGNLYLLPSLVSVNVGICKIVIGLEVSVDTVQSGSMPLREVCFDQFRYAVRGSSLACLYFLLSTSHHERYRLVVQSLLATLWKTFLCNDPQPSCTIRLSALAQ